MVTCCESKSTCNCLCLNSHEKLANNCCVSVQYWKLEKMKKKTMEVPWVHLINVEVIVFTVYRHSHRKMSNINWNRYFGTEISSRNGGGGGDDDDVLFVLVRHFIIRFSMRFFCLKKMLLYSNTAVKQLNATKRKMGFNQQLHHVIFFRYLTFITVEQLIKCIKQLLLIIKLVWCLSVFFNKSLR